MSLREIIQKFLDKGFKQREICQILRMTEEQYWLIDSNYENKVPALQQRHIISNYLAFDSAAKKWL